MTAKCVLCDFSVAHFPLSEYLYLYTVDAREAMTLRLDVLIYSAKMLFYCASMDVGFFYFGLRGCASNIDKHFICAINARLRLAS